MPQKCSNNPYSFAMRVSWKRLLFVWLELKVYNQAQTYYELSELF